MVGFEIIKIALKASIEAGHIVTAIGENFGHFLAPPTLGAIDHNSSILGHGFEYMSQWIKRSIDGTFDRVSGEIGRFPQIEQRNRIRVELGEFFRRDVTIRTLTALIGINHIMQINRYVLPLSF